MRLRRLLVFLSATALAAQEPMPFLAVGEGVEHGWTLAVGARLMDYSSYLGSDRQRMTLLPVFAAEYDRTFYLGSSRVGPGFGGGVHLKRFQDFTWDLGLGVGDNRPESRSPLLTGMGNRRADLFAGTGLHYRRDGYHVGLTLSHGLRDDAGNLATLTLGKAIPLLPRWHLSLGLHSTWADTKAMTYDFGITPEQAANRAALVTAGNTNITQSEIGPFTPSAGVRDLGGLVGLTYRPRDRWVWTLGLNGGFLQGDIRNSPLVGRNDYVGLGLGFAYRF